MKEVNSYIAMLIVAAMGSGATYLIVETAFNEDLLAAFAAEANQQL